MTRAMLIGISLLGLVTGALSRAAGAPTVSCISLDPSRLPSLTAAAGQAGLTPTRGNPDGPPDGPVVVWEAVAGPTDITPARAAWLDGYVRNGGSLWLSLGRSPGAGPTRLAFLLPTTAWRTRIAAASRGEGGSPVDVGEWDHELFPQAAPQGMRLSYHYGIRPTDAVERGEARYESLPRTLLHAGGRAGPGQFFWTRPLMNRDWRVRISGSDTDHSPLLVTGRYGAGRVAVLGGSLADLDGSPAGRAVETDVLRWLVGPGAAAPEGEGAAPTITPAVVVDAPGRRLRVTLTNPQAAALPVQIVARIETWEPAPVGDQTQTVTLPANGQATVDVPLPALNAESYQALDARDAYSIRLGVLSASGAHLLGETRVSADLRPAVTLSVATDDLRAIPRPFHAPGPRQQEARMGLPIWAYAYAPGQTVGVSVTVSNGARDLAPSAQAQDETQPDNPSIPALNDRAAVAGKGPIDGIEAYSVWEGKAGEENVLRFTFPHPILLSAVTLIGVPADDKRSVSHNPGAVVLEADGKPVAQADDLDARFAAGFGRVTFPVAPITVTTVRLRLPWRASLTSGKPRALPWLGEVMLTGADSAPPAASGVVSLVLHDALSGVDTPIGRQNVTVAPGTSQQAVFSVPLPSGPALRFLRLEARFGDAQGSAPVLVIQPDHPLRPLSDARPANAPALGFIVTNGFRNGFDIGTGTQETLPGWGQPDDLVWAYSRRLKQVGKAARTEANRLYVSDSDLRHYATPWDTFVNGEAYFPLAAPNYIAKMKKMSSWSQSDVAVLEHSDRWDTGPSVDSLYNWQDFVGFDEYLRGRGLPGLHGRTRQELADEIDARDPAQWQAWQLSRYIENVRAMRADFAAVGKRLLITAQGTPLVPIPDQEDLAQTIRGMSDDSTWGMAGESIPLTTGRQMASLAFNPVWAMSTLLQWGYNSAVLESHFHTPVGTTEPSRRHYYDRAWRAMIGMDGAYHSMHTYGYNSNAGVAYTMTDNDWQQWWQVQERHSLLSPDGPLGVGLVLNTAYMNDPARTFFSGGGMGGSAAESNIMGIANVLRRLHEAGVSVPFSTNIAALTHWTGTAPLLALNLSQATPSEVAIYQTLAARGVPLAAFRGNGPLPAGAAALFGVTSSGAAAGAHSVGSLRGMPVLARANALLIPGAFSGFTASDAQALAPILHQAMRLPITYPDGTAGYGFTMQGKSFLEIEDWQEQGRVVALRLRAHPNARTARACEINDHQTLAVRRDGADWVISLPLRPGDGDVVCVEETP
jgi:hypothetical protein